MHNQVKTTKYINSQMGTLCQSMTKDSDAPKFYSTHN